MSERYPGGFITKNAPQPTGGESGTAPGVWTLEQAAEYQKVGTWPSPPTPKYIEDVFSTYLYTGNGSTQTITNDIDLLNKGGLIWFKTRSPANNHNLLDTQRGLTGSQALLVSNTTAAATTLSTTVTALSNGFSLNGSGNGTNQSGYTYASWTFRKQAKFFDIVTYTGNGSNQTIAHNLGSVPGCIIVKKTSATGPWYVYHRSRGATEAGQLNTTGAFLTDSIWNNTSPTSTVFSVNSSTNDNGATYVAYLFAHDAGGFGALGTDNVISCGLVTDSPQQVTLGWEPQWIFYKTTGTTGDWNVFDNMRGMTADGSGNYLQFNTTNAEATASGQPAPNATGFYWFSGTGSPVIYIAIRRGPMKTPTSGATVFEPFSRAGTGTNTTISLTSMPFADLFWTYKTQGANTASFARLTGGNWLQFPTTGAEISDTTSVTAWPNKGVSIGADTTYQIINASGSNYAQYAFTRAPGFFDVVCFTAGSSTNRRVDHNLTVAPQFIIIKTRNVSQSWYAYSQPLGINAILYPNENFAQGTLTNAWGTSPPTSTTFGINETVFASPGNTYVAYLFATCPGVSKVGSYTGTGTTLQVDCGFTGGARFVMIKSASISGDWYIWDSARGIVAGNDPYFLLNSSNPQVTSTDYVDTYSAGFEISSTAPAEINFSGGTFIFLAIA